MKDLCRQYRETYGETGLPSSISEHGSHCPECKEFARTQEALEGVLPAWQAPETSSDFALNVMARIAENEKKPQSIGEWLNAFINIQLVVPMPAVAFSVLLLVVSLPMNVFFLSSSSVETGLSGQQITEAPANPSGSQANVSNYMQPTVPAGQVIQVNQMEQQVPGLSLPPNLYGAGAFLLIPIVDPLVLTPDLTETQPSEVSDI